MAISSFDVKNKKSEQVGLYCIDSNLDSNMTPSGTSGNYLVNIW